MTDDDRVPISKAKGRPMLQWVGKRPLGEQIQYTDIWATTRASILKQAGLKGDES